MSRSSRGRPPVATATLIALLLTGCATGGQADQAPGGQPTGSTAAASTEAGAAGAPVSPDRTTPTPPRRPPSGLPTEPTDNLPTDLVVGTVTAGGSGPCYGMTTDDGVQYALYGRDGVTLTEGDTIRVWIEPLMLQIFCGPGQHVAITKIEIVG